MHTCISSHGLKRSWRSCPRRVNAGNKNTLSTHHPRRRNVTTLMVGLKKRSHMQKSHPKVVNPRDIAGERKKTKNKKNSLFWRKQDAAKVTLKSSPIHFTVEKMEIMKHPTNSRHTDWGPRRRKWSQMNNKMIKWFSGDTTFTIKNEEDMK